MTAREVADMTAWREKQSMRRQNRDRYRELAKLAVWVVVVAAGWGLLLGLLLGTNP